MKQTGFFKPNSQHDFSHGGSLRRKRAGRGRRPLSTKEPLHSVFKVNRERLVHGSLRNGVTHTLVHRVVRKYAKRFFVKIEQLSVQADHCHLLIRAPRRSQYHYFFRVVAGQIAQRFEKEGLLEVAYRSKKPVTDTPEKPRACENANDLLSDEDICFSNAKWDSETSGTGLWKHRPFSRVIRGYRAYAIVRDYIQLNELEAQGRIPYRKRRLRGLSAGEWEILWT